MKIAQGRKAITLGGERVELLCTPRAAVKISDAFGGLLTAQQRCITLDVTAIIAIINAGANRSGEDAKKTEDQVFEAGLNDIAGDVIDFITLLANGGKPKADETAGSAGGNGQG